MQSEFVKLGMADTVQALDFASLEDTASTESVGAPVAVAAAVAKPLVIHTRSASADTLAMLRSAQTAAGGALSGVFHCFTETAEVARAALDLGFDISFSGILTFKTAADLRAVAAFVPLDRCLIETDSPYLAPVPHRGRSNSPAWVPHVAAELARIKALPVGLVAAATSRNFERLFQLPQPANPTKTP